MPAALTDLCGLWQQLVAHPDNADVVARARRHLEELTDHVDECDRCIRAGEKAGDPAAIYLALAGTDDTLAAEDRAVLERMLEANANDERQVAAAVEEALLPSLSTRVVQQYKQLRELFSEVSPRVVYLAVEAVAMLVRRVAHHRGLVRDQMELGPTGAITVKGTEIVPARTVVREISRFAHVAEPTAERLAAWIPSAAYSQPNLFRGLQVARLGLQRDRVNLTLAAGGEETEDLYARWSPSATRSYTPATGLEDVAPVSTRGPRRGVAFASQRPRTPSGTTPAASPRPRSESDGRGHSSEAAAAAETPSEDRPRSKSREK